MCGAFAIQFKLCIPILSEEIMVTEFSDELQADAHSLFQDWRLENPEGFFLSQKGKGSYLLHHVGCHHVGNVFWDSADTKHQSSLTASRKICSSNPDELLVWVEDGSFTHGICRHCVDSSDPSHLKPSNSAKQRMDGWIVSLSEWVEAHKDELENATTQTTPDVVKGDWQFQEELPADATLFEGARVVVQVSAFERNPIARQKCIAHYGTSCSVCGFNFGATYGSSAESYIHAHHLKPLASIGEEYVIDPIKDLRPVCANCHAVIHLRQPPYSIEEVKAMLHSDANA